jgi:hypothetical protein
MQITERCDFGLTAPVASFAVCFRRGEWRSPPALLKYFSIFTVSVFKIRKYFIIQGMSLSGMPFCINSQKQMVNAALAL